MPDYDIKNAPQSDILAFFGGNADRASNDPELIAWVKTRKPSYYFSVCTGAFILGRAGLLDNQSATTFHSSIDNLRKEFPQAKILSGVRFVDNGEIITTAGISAGIDGALHLVAKLKGEEIAKNTAYYMEYDKWVPKEGLIVDK
jgi:transcriptional regulator GlxA family with amidase domain